MRVRADARCGSTARRDTSAPRSKCPCGRAAHVTLDDGRSRTPSHARARSRSRPTADDSSTSSATSSIGRAATTMFREHASRCSSRRRPPRLGSLRRGDRAPAHRGAGRDALARSRTRTRSMLSSRAGCATPTTPRRRSSASRAAPARTRPARRPRAGLSADHGTGDQSRVETRVRPRATACQSTRRRRTRPASRRPARASREVARLRAGELGREPVVHQREAADPSRRRSPPRSAAAPRPASTPAGRGTASSGP